MPVINARFLTQRISGVQRVAIEISRRLKKLRPDIILVAPRNILHTELAGELDVRIHGRLTGHAWEQLELPGYVKRHKATLLINLANSAPLTGGPKIVTIHDLAFRRHPEWFSRKFAGYYRLMIPRIARSAAKVITDSDFSKGELMDLMGLAESDIRVIPCAVDSCFSPVTSDTVEHSRYLLAVSSVDPRKNFQSVIRAFQQLNRSDLRLLIVGAAHEAFSSSSGIEASAADNRIDFTGYVSDGELVDLYRHAELFVFPSLYEGFGLPPLEAMACGCPCVVSDAGSLPEVCGDAAAYCDPNNVVDIADKINMVLNDSHLRSALIQKGLIRAAEFTWDRAASEYLNVIEGAE